MARLVIDPVTRIEGHLRIEAQVANGHVREAWASGTMFRGLELILQGRDPRDAWLFTQRICNVCTMVHALASVRAVEDALGVKPPPLAVLIRNLITAFQYVQDHVVHFYHLHALDWVDITSALKADPADAAALAGSISDWPENSAQQFKDVQDKLKAFVASGMLGIYANGYWGHPAYKLPPAANLMAVAHYLQALDWQKEVIKAHAVLGGKNPLLQTFLVGGMAIPVDPSSPWALNADRLALLRSLAAKGKEFVEKVYIPDLLAVASFYKDWAGLGEGTKNFLTCGELPLDPSGDPRSFAFPSGVILDRNLSSVQPFRQEKVTEQVARSWYHYTAGEARAFHPWEGETIPRYSGPKPPYEHLDVESKYSWLKAPRYDGHPMEVGPLARVLVAYASGTKRIKELVDLVLTKLDAPPAALFSTLGRTAARGIETLYMAELIPTLLDQLTAAMKSGDTKTHAGRMWDPSEWPKEARGAGFHEAPRGALGHWVLIEDGKISRYQCVVPTTWNASPRDWAGTPGPYEAALAGTPVADEAKPIEILRTIHSFDPCIACAVHVLDARGTPVSVVEAV
ncbi:MAG: nickel-dependent hydrogenase large subunit [Acidobacteria bacterium]|nr:nickel-dependent hydrogenase large subunit [Acidobacteriota bacterium]